MKHEQKFRPPPFFCFDLCIVLHISKYRNPILDFLLSPLTLTKAWLCVKAVGAISCEMPQPVLLLFHCSWNYLIVEQILYMTIVHNFTQESTWKFMLVLRTAHWIFCFFFTGPLYRLPVWRHAHSLKASTNVGYVWNSLLTSQRTRVFLFERLLYRDVMALCCENHMEHKCTTWERCRNYC